MTAVNGVRVSERQIVSTGSANGVSARILVTVDASRGDPVFPLNYGIVSRDPLVFRNNATVSGGGIGSNGDIVFKNNASVCGKVTPGPGHTLSHGPNWSQCSGFSSTPAAAPFPFQPVDMAAANATEENVRITNMKNGLLPADSCSGCAAITWNAGARVLTIGSGATLTLSGNSYSFCQLNIPSGGKLQISSRTEPLWIYIDTPESCGAGMGSVSLLGQVVNINTNPATFALAVAGSSAIATAVSIGDNTITAASAPMSLYAPNSDVDFSNNLDWAGAMMVKSLSVRNNTSLIYDPRIPTSLSPGWATRRFEPQGYKDCAVLATTTVPNSGC